MTRFYCDTPTIHNDDALKIASDEEFKRRIKHQTKLIQEVKQLKIVLSLIKSDGSVQQLHLAVAILCAHKCTHYSVAV